MSPMVRGGNPFFIGVGFMDWGLEQSLIYDDPHCSCYGDPGQYRSTHHGEFVLTIVMTRNSY